MMLKSNRYVSPRAALRKQRRRESLIDAQASWGVVTVRPQARATASRLRGAPDPFLHFARVWIEVCPKMLLPIVVLGGDGLPPSVMTLHQARKCATALRKAGDARASLIADACRPLAQKAVDNFQLRLKLREFAMTKIETARPAQKQMTTRARRKLAHA